jgi:hypothetical protein
MMNYCHRRGGGLEEKFALEIGCPRNLFHGSFIWSPEFKLELSTCSESGRGGSQTRVVGQIVSDSERG